MVYIIYVDRISKQFWLIMYLFFDNVPSNPKAEIRLLKLPSPSEPGAGWCRICTALLKTGFNRPYANQGSRPSLICVQISWYTERTVGVYLFCIYVLCIAIIPKPKLCIFFIFWVLFWNLRPRKPPNSYTISLYYVPN